MILLVTEHTWKAVTSRHGLAYYSSQLSIKAIFRISLSICLTRKQRKRKVTITVSVPASISSRVHSGEPFGAREDSSFHTGQQLRHQGTGGPLAPVLTRLKVC